MNPILVTGTLGNVGAEVIHHLITQRIDPSMIRAADLDVDNIRNRFGDAVKAVPFDYAISDTFVPAFAGVEAMFVMRPPQISNVQKDMLPALEAARSADVKRMVFLSLIGIEHNKAVPHFKVEQWMVQSGLDYTFLRCSFFMQNFNTTHQAEIRERDEIYVPVGHARTSFLDVRDTGAVAALALTTPGHAQKAYDLTGSEAMDYNQVAELFTQVLGRKITYKNPPAFNFFLRQLRTKSNLMYALVTTWLYQNTKNGMANRVTGEVERLLGRKPIRMRQYIQDYRSAWQR